MLRKLILKCFGIRPIEVEVEYEGIHEHKCVQCGHTWKHGFQHEDRAAAHTCSECGAEEQYQ